MGAGKFMPLGRQTQYSEGAAALAQCSWTHGPEWGIVQRLLQRRAAVFPPATPGARKPRIYLIKFAMGSSSLAEDWAPDGDYFPQFVNFTKEMLEVIAQEGVPPKIDCFMWHQGNTDAGTGKWKNAYQANLVKFVKETWRALE